VSADNSNDNNTQSFIALTSGTLVSHYRIVEKIGAGGMGEVYLAEDTQLDRKVALKFLPPHLCQDEDCRKRFKREAQAAAKLSHPNIIHVYEVSEYQGRPFFAMEHIEGRSLRDVKAEELDVDRIIGIAIQLCDGLYTAHSAGVTHRDIKPSNIIVDSSGRPKLLDFGLAVVKGGEHLTRTGSTLGTVGYMSPEQIEGKATDARSDLFSLGVVLYELIASKSPFRRDDETATLKAILQDTPEPLARYKSSVPDDLQRVVGKLLEKDPTLRYQSAAGVIPDLKKLSAASTVSMVSERKPDRWNRYVVPSAVVILLAVVAIWYFGYRDQTPSTSSTDDRIMLAVLPFENLGDPEDEFFADGITDEITSKVGVLDGLGVIARTSILQYKGTTKRIAEIGSELNVDYILEGTIRWDKSGEVEKVRITPQLIRVSDETHLWADNYERDLTQIFTVQSEIAGHVAEALDITLRTTHRRLLEATPTGNLDAYVYFLRGRENFELGRWQGPGETAIEMLERAVELDSSFSTAYAWLARAYGVVYLNRPDYSELSDLAKHAAEAAYRLSNQGPDGHMAMGYYYYYCRKEYDLALQHFSSVLVAQPNNSDAIEAIAYIQRRLGKWEESLSSLQRAAELDPRSIRKVLEMQTNSLALRQYDLGRQYFELGCEISPDAKALYDIECWRWVMGYGDTRQARQIIEKGQRRIGPGPLAEELEYLDILDRDFESALQRRPTADASTPLDDFDYYLLKGYIYLLLGDSSTAFLYADSARTKYERIVAQASESPIPRSRLAVALAGVGRYEEAMRECERALGVFSRTEDALLYPFVLADAARVYVLSGDYDRAVEMLDSLLSIPSVYSVHELKLDPLYDPLRDHPRFKALIEKYENEYGN